MLTQIFEKIIIKKRLKSIIKRHYGAGCQTIVSTSAGMSSEAMRPRKFQKELREALSPDWEIDYISDDLSEALPQADVIVIPKTNRTLYAERAKDAKVVWVSGNEVVENDIEGIKRKIVEV